MKKHFFIFFCLIIQCIIFSNLIVAQPIIANNRYEFKSGADHLSLFASLGLNLSGNKVNTDYGNANLKAGNGLVFIFGPQYQYHFTKTFFIRGGIQVGVISHAYKFKETLKAKSDSLWVEFDDKYTRKSIAPIILSPKLELGKQFFADNYLIEVAVGGSFEKYLNRNIDAPFEKNVSKTTLSNRDVVDVEVANRKYFGLNKWGGFNGEFYIGYRKMGFNDFTNRISFGLNFIFTVDNTTVGFAEVLNYNVKYQYPMGKQVFNMQNMAVTFKLAYDIF